MMILFMSVSFTAQTMALQRAMETARPRSSRLFDDPLARDFLRGPLRAAADLAAVPVVGRVVPALYDVIWPGPRPSAVARTRLIDDTLAEALADGITQVVLLGAGFDSRAWRLPAIRRAHVIEVDRPDTQHAKVAALRRTGQPLERVRFTPVDFERDDLAAAIRAADLATDRPAVFVWEGVTNYLSAAAVDQTLSVLRALAAPGTLLLFTYVHQGVIDGSAHFPEAARWVRSVARAGEAWTFGFVPAALPGYLASRGFTLSWDVSTAEGRPPLLRPGAPPRPRLRALPRGPGSGPMPKLTARTAAARRQQILDAATACFSERGIHATTMQDICQRAGLSPGAVYCWFTGKEAIIDAVADERHARERDMLQAAATAGDPRAAFSSFFDAYLDWLADPAEQRRRRVSIQMWADALVNDRLRASVRAGTDQQAIARDFITAAQAAGDLPADIPADGLTRVLLAIIQGFILQQAWDPGIDIASYRQAVTFLIDALTSHPRST